MPMLVMRIGRMRVGMRALLVTVRVAMLAAYGGIVGMVMMTVVMAVRVLVLDRMMRVQMPVFFCQV